MGTSYLEIHKLFLQKISDFDMGKLSDSDLQEMCLGFMTSAITKIKPLKSDLSKRDDYKLCFEDVLLDVEKEIIALQMVCEWAEPQLNNTLLLKQFVGWKEEKFFAQANQIAAIQAVRDSAENKSKELRRDYSYWNSSYLGS